MLLCPKNRTGEMWGGYLTKPTAALFGFVDASVFELTITFLVIRSKYKVPLCEAERKDLASSGAFVLRKSQSAHGCAPIRFTFEQIRLMAQFLINNLLSLKRKLFSIYLPVSLRLVHSGPRVVELFSPQFKFTGPFCSDTTTVKLLQREAHINNRPK
jgi:hypothetical protein